MTDYNPEQTDILDRLATVLDNLPPRLRDQYFIDQGLTEPLSQNTLTFFRNCIPLLEDARDEISGLRDEVDLLMHELRMMGHEH